MTKPKADPRPHRFTPGHTINVKAPGTQLVGIRAMVTKEQRAWLTQQGNISATVKEAIDLLISTQVLAASSRDGPASNRSGQSGVESGVIPAPPML